jgi:pimeloyl-ACP methyl ester carboxylesterase
MDPTEVVVRAREPEATGTAVSTDGVRLAWEAFGEGNRTILLLPSAPIVHSLQWKAQVHFLSRSWRVVTFDGRGNGRSDRPNDPEAFRIERILDDIRAVLDATGTRAAVLVGLCGDGVWPAIRLAAEHPERVEGIVAIAVGVPLLSAPHPWYAARSFEAEADRYDGWAKYNRQYWRRDYPDFARFFFSAIATEPHSTKVIDDCVEWAVGGSVDSMLADADAPSSRTLESVEATCRAVSCPMLLIHGDRDHCQPLSRAHRLSELTGAPLVILAGADHLAPARHPVPINLLIRDFMHRLEATP